MRKTLGVVIAVTSALVIAGCSSSSSSSSTSGSGASSSSASSSSSAGGSASSGVTAAKAYEAQWLSSPTSINISTPLKSKPPAGKLLVGLDSGLGSAKVLAQYWAQAAADAGWTYKDLISGGTSSTQQSAMNSAIQLNPAGILTSGISNSTIQTQLALAAQKG